MKNLENQIKQLQKEIEQIKERNKRVEADKAWEVSRIRTGFIALLTFIFVIGFVILIDDPKPIQKGIIAACGYFLSTETYGVIKKWWLKRKL